MAKDKEKQELEINQIEEVSELDWGVEEEPVIEAEQTYPRTELIANVQTIFGVMPEVLAGALYDNKLEELTISEVKKAIQEFLQRRVG